MLALGGFGAAYMGDPDGFTMDLRWLMVSLMRRYGGGLDGLIAVHAPSAVYTLALTPDRLVSRDGAPVRPDAALHADLPALGALLGRRQEDAPVRIEGDRELVFRLVRGLA